MFPIFKLKGSAYEIGCQHGKLAKKQIGICIDTYQQLFMSYAGLEWTEAVDQAEQYVSHIEKYSPDLMAEIRGIADGCGRDLLDIVTLNARSEIMLTTKAVDGCTSFGITPQAGKDGVAYMGQNWDWKDTVFDALIALVITQEGKPNIRMITEAGIVGKFGLNDAGIGICMNALACEESVPGVPLHVVMRGILNSPNLGEAIGNVGNAQIASAANWVIGHQEGEIMDLEVTPSEFDVLYPEEGILVHTNHFTSAFLKPRLKDITKYLLPDSMVRYNRARRLLAESKGSIALDELGMILSDHFNYPHGICRHLKEDSSGKQIVSVFSIIMDLSNQDIFVATGNPCQTPFEKWHPQDDD